MVRASRSRIHARSFSRRLHGKCNADKPRAQGSKWIDEAVAQERPDLIAHAKPNSSSSRKLGPG